MADTTISTSLVGCTGLVGSQILRTLLSLPSQPTTYAIARRALPTDSANLKSRISSDTSTWAGYLRNLSPPPNVFFSALGTSKAQAGSLAAQHAIDYDLNLSLARAAKESGVKVYVLVSSAAVSTTSPFPYSKMKASLEEAVKEIGFPYTVIVKPGLLVGTREDSRPAEAMFRGVAKCMGAVSKAWFTDWWAQDVDVIGRAVVNAGMQCVEGKRKEGLWEVNQSEIIKLGRTEWK